MTTEEGPTLLDCILGSDRTKHLPVICMHHLLIHTQQFDGM
jgi:hypothetical protein